MYKSLTQISRRSKLSILLGLDLALVPISIVAALVLRYGMTNPVPLLTERYAFILSMTVVGAIVIYGFGLHRIKLQSIAIRAIGQIGLVSIVLVIAAIVLSYTMNAATPRSVPVIVGALFFVLAVSSRILGIALLSMLREFDTSRTPVAIYGAGSAGVQLATALATSEHLRPFAFLDDKASLQGLEIAGLRVHAPADIIRLRDWYDVRKVILAIPSSQNMRRKEVIESLAAQGFEVQMLPSHAELLERGDLEEKLQSVGPDDLLGRKMVDLAIPEIARVYAGRSVMVTGAGGSIGSELCRQLTDCSPRRIVLFEHSEHALYQIERELRAVLSDTKIEILACLGSVTDDQRVRQIIASKEIDIILHAAAYKHVPLVEYNEPVGARNNVLGTLTVAKAACDAGIERFILVSTDKAVRPTNIMGATKRLAELVVQDLQKQTERTRLSMVRFGNVLGSSGSIYPLFQEQLAAGGPLTVTHPEVTRYFMTIPEASCLVLLAGAYSEGGDVFVLDMGKPMKIIDVARRMIELSGARVKEEGEHTGIGISIIGLRPGEKLYEELLIDGDRLCVTPHEKILRAVEVGLSEIEMAGMLSKLNKAIEEYDSDAVRDVVRQYVNGYHQPVTDDVSAAAPQDPEDPEDDKVMMLGGLALSSG
jgi:FlaA1/EpsC-like NDP-sugar epimerase